MQGFSDFFRSEIFREIKRLNYRMFEKISYIISNISAFTACPPARGKRETPNLSARGFSLSQMENL